MKHIARSLPAWLEEELRPGKTAWKFSRSTLGAGMTLKSAFSGHWSHHAQTDLHTMDQNLEGNAVNHNVGPHGEVRWRTPGLQDETPPKETSSQETPTPADTKQISTMLHLASLVNKATGASCSQLTAAAMWPYLSVLLQALYDTGVDISCLSEETFHKIPDLEEGPTSWLCKNWVLCCSGSTAAIKLWPKISHYLWLTRGSHPWARLHLPTWHPLQPHHMSPHQGGPRHVELWHLPPPSGD